jgi:hypothetical protein
MHLRTLIAALLLASPNIPARAGDVGWLMPPVDGVVAQRFQAPEGDWGPGHRGIDYEVPRGTAVRAAASGTVTFAGEVAGFPAVTIAHPNGLSTTYSILSGMSVTEGEAVGAGQWIGEVGEVHPGAGSGLHLGVKLEGEYVDPEDHLGPLDVGNAIHLAPLTWEPPDAAGDLFDIPPGPQSWDPECLVQTSLERASRPPNANVAVAVAGIGSHTRGGLAADMYEHGPEWLGYPGDKVYRFSYRGTHGPGLHEPYLAADTYRDLIEAAHALKELIDSVGRLHPGVGVDLIAHSQGGVVARAYLELVAEEWEVDRPRIEHLVTFATPHTGAPAAAVVPDLDEHLWGRLLVDGLGRWSDSGGPVPHPRSPAVLQLDPGSDLMQELGRTRTLFGTRILALGIPNDLIVPANRALLESATSRIVPPSGVNGHSAIVASGVARAIAYGFLRDAPETCPTSWDSAGPAIGSLVGVVERAVGRLPGLIVAPWRLGA